ncbi:hypothetical protein HYS48_04525 [Candidatus Woesearchaeota archaeon]|nr:hypothetical protein [Candidatus Woesearchaeota archaeon]
MVGFSPERRSHRTDRSIPVLDSLVVVASTTEEEDTLVSFTPDIYSPARFWNRMYRHMMDVIEESLAVLTDMGWLERLEQARNEIILAYNAKNVHALEHTLFCLSNKARQLLQVPPEQRSTDDQEECVYHRLYRLSDAYCVLARKWW